MKELMGDIREKTSGMTGKEKCDYIWTYYWYHILGGAALLGLILLFAWHYGFGNKKPVFTCALVNQEMEGAQVQEMGEEFAGRFGLPEGQVVVSADYVFSYGEVVLEGVNESAYEKFFFQWRNEEIDAVILPESFYFYVKEMGGEFKELEGQMAEGFVPYMDGDRCRAVVLGNDGFTEKISGKKDEKLLLAFPETGGHVEEGKMFLEFLRSYAGVCRSGQRGGAG